MMIKKVKHGISNVAKSSSKKNIKINRRIIKSTVARNLKIHQIQQIFANTSVVSDVKAHQSFSSFYKNNFKKMYGSRNLYGEHSFNNDPVQVSKRIARTDLETVSRQINVGNLNIKKILSTKSGIKIIDSVLTKRTKKNNLLKID